MRHFRGRPARSVGAAVLAVPRSCRRVRRSRWAAQCPPRRHAAAETTHDAAFGRHCGPACHALGWPTRRVAAAGPAAAVLVADHDRWSARRYRRAARWSRRLGTAVVPADRAVAACLRQATYRGDRSGRRPPGRRGIAVRGARVVFELAAPCARPRHGRGRHRWRFGRRIFARADGRRRYQRPRRDPRPRRQPSQRRVAVRAAADAGVGTGWVRPVDPRFSTRRFWLFRRPVIRGSAPSAEPNPRVET